MKNAKAVKYSRQNKYGASVKVEADGRRIEINYDILAPDVSVFFEMPWEIPFITAEDYHIIAVSLAAKHICEVYPELKRLREIQCKHGNLSWDDIDTE